MPVGGLALTGVVVVLIAALAASRLVPSDRSGASRSTVVGSFITQVDGVYGYEALRPAGWTPVDLGDRRIYFAPGPETPDQGLLVSIANVKVSGTGPNGDLGGDGALGDMTYWHLFGQDPGLAAWTAAVDRTWTSAGIEATVVRSLPDATIYSLSVPNSSPLVMLVALKVTGGVPLEIDLDGGGTYADLTNLEQSGVIDDFVLIINSAQAIAIDPTNVLPLLPAASFDVPAPTSSSAGGSTTP